MAIVVPAHADATVKVTLWDKVGTMDMSKSMGVKGDTKMAIMGTHIDQKTVPAGKVTFEVSNTSKGTVREMLVAPIAAEDAVLPFIDAENRADEINPATLAKYPSLMLASRGRLLWS
jgi:uncharacterized cupredoxin-like copper-binding protein